MSRGELRDRFGPLPEEVENLLSLVELRAAAGAVGAESVLRSGSEIVIKMRSPVGSARVPLQRALGPSVTVGNQQVKVPLRGLGDQWLSRLTRILERLHVFQERLRSIAGQLQQQSS